VLRDMARCTGDQNSIIDGAKHDCETQLETLGGTLGGGRSKDISKDHWPVELRLRLVRTT